MREMGRIVSEKTCFARLEVWRAQLETSWVGESAAG